MISMSFDVQVCRLACVLVSAIMLGMPGCSTVPRTLEMPEGGTAFAFSAGRGSQSFPAPVASVVEAVNNSMSDLNMTSVRHSIDGTVIRIDGKTTDQRQTIAVIRSHLGVTHVSVRIGWFGDEPLSRALLERAAVRLGSREPEAIPATAPSAPSHNPFFSRSAVPDSVMLRDLAESLQRDRVIP
jgi:hypothetical protein